MQIGTLTRLELGSFCAWSGSELDLSSGWSGSELVCGSELVSSTAWSGSERFSSSAWSGSELVSSTVWSGSELGSFEVRRCGVDRSLARLRRAWIVVRRCGSFRLARCVGRSSEGLREAVHV